MSRRPGNTELDSSESAPSVPPPTAAAIDAESDPAERADTAPAFVPADPLYADQWHFNLMGNGGGTFHIEAIWEEFDGSGINVGVYDSGVQSIHYDLNDNYDPSLHVVVDGTDLARRPDRQSAG